MLEHFANTSLPLKVLFPKNVIFLKKKGKGPSLAIVEQSRNIAPPLPVAEQKHPEIVEKQISKYTPSLNFMNIPSPLSLWLLPQFLINLFCTDTLEGLLPEQLMTDCSEGIFRRSERRNSISAELSDLCLH